MKQPIKRASNANPVEDAILKVGEIFIPPLKEISSEDEKGSFAMNSDGKMTYNDHNKEVKVIATQDQVQVIIDELSTEVISGDSEGDIDDEDLTIINGNG